MKREIENLRQVCAQMEQKLNLEEIKASPKCFQTKKQMRSERLDRLGECHFSRTANPAGNLENCRIDLLLHFFLTVLSDTV